MRFFNKNIWLTTFLFIAISITTGCGSSKAPITRFYILDPLESERLSGEKTDQTPSLSIGITSFRLPQYLERPQIVTRSSANRLELAEFHQWGGNLRKNMTRTLAKNLSRILDTPEIFIYPDIPKASTDFHIELTVTKFERDPDNKVRLSAQWRLSEKKTIKHLKTEMSELESPTIYSISDMSETVKAMSELMGELSLIIGQELLNFTHSKSDSL